MQRTAFAWGMGAISLACAAAFAACGSGDNTVTGGPDGSSGADVGTHPGVDAGTGSEGSSPDAPEADAWLPLPPTPDKPQLWYWHHAYLSPTSATEPAHSKQLIDQAVAAGYTGLALWDSSLSFLTRPGWDSKNLKAVIDYAVSKGLALLPSAIPYGYSNDMLQADPNLAEGQRVVGTQMKVVASGVGNVLQAVSSLAPVQDGDFASATNPWFGIGDACLGIDTTTGHNDSVSAKLSATSANCRLTYALKLTPWRLYHVQFWVKAQGFAQNTLDLEVIDWKLDPNGLARIALPAPVQGTQGFTQVDFAFNSRESTDVTLYLGSWGGFAGTLWVDDIAVEETALVNVLRRAGTPLKIYDAATTYVEGTDVANIVDPALAARPGNYDAWHAPPTVTVPAGSRLSVGQTVSLDYYSVFPSIAGGVGACLSEPAVQKWVHDDTVDIAALFPAGTGMFVSYDEMRHMNSCALCRSKALEAGPLLAGNVVSTWQTVHGAMPGARLYTWNDMFDPNHNAVKNYYSVEGDIAGSWRGLPPGTIIMNWNLGKLAASLGWFSGKAAGQPHGFQQIIAGYYDSGDGKAAATSEMAAAAGIPGIIGAMYTTWGDDYGQLKAFADGVKAAWAAYKASVP